MSERDALRARLHGIYALIDPARAEPIAFVEALVRGGVRVVQIRAKDGIDGTTLLAIVDRVRAAGGVTILNDDVGLARLADGVHLGQEDAAQYDLAELRTAFGPRPIIGLSCGTPQEAARVDPAIVDYVGVGPLFATGSKDDAGLPIGVSGARAVIDASPVPCAVIGGIGAATLVRAKETGAAMAAVLSALAVADPAGAARALVDRWG
ncbi:MAG: thiamine phosphate synthase [Vulcanimicrobiaceae bacterium]|jgi:thiamine-phosphate pyrophosphorylase